ncbi:MAG TPA: DUF5666 domain-containing protein [Nitrospiraceae bacterium]|nr:DUF5666 domain-containing protein [Nitrospiraceae bacterium]
MRTKLTAFIIVMSLAVSVPGFALGTDQPEIATHVLGTIVTIDASHVEVRTPKGQSVDVRIDKKTLYKDQHNPKGSTVPEVGDRVIIKATKQKKVLLATEIYFSAAKRAQASMPPAPVQ